MIIATGSMHQKNGKIDAIEVRNDRASTTHCTPRETHQPVGSVIDFAMFFNTSEQTAVSWELVLVLTLKFLQSFG